MAKMSLTFNGFDALAYGIDKAGGNIKKAVDEALTESEKIVQDEVASAAAPYATPGGGRRGYATGAMYSSIIKSPKVYWKGMVAEVGVGFDLQQAGGYHSIFVMYGTPRMSKDPKIYNAIRGARTRQMIAKKQAEVMQKWLDISKGGK